MTPLLLQDVGARFVEAWEGFRATPYNDTQGNATVGIGHLLGYRPVGPWCQTAGVTLAPGAVTGFAGTLTLTAALKLLEHDAETNALEPLRRNLTVPLDEAQVTALVSLGFNCGPGSLSPNGAVMRAVNSRPAGGKPGTLELAQWHSRVTAAVMLWDNPAVLIRRRQSEAHLFATSQYTRAQGNVYSNE